MNAGLQRLLVALFTVLVFGAGYGARAWIERNRPVPAPLQPGTEFAPQEIATNDNGRPPGPSRTQIISDIERWQADIDTYQTRLNAIDAEYQKGFLALLTPDQREQYDADQKRRAGRGPRAGQRGSDSTALLSNDDIDRLRNYPLMGVLNRISVASWVDRLSDEYQLDDAQKVTLHDLLATRRERFIDLIDSTPPPSIRLSSLAPVVSRLGQPSDAAGAAAAPRDSKPKAQ